MILVFTLLGQLVQELENRILEYRAGANSWRILDVTLKKGRQFHSVLPIPAFHEAGCWNDQFEINSGSKSNPSIVRSSRVLFNTTSADAGKLSFIIRYAFVIKLPRFFGCLK